MMVRILALGNKMPAWVNEGFQEYAKRLTHAFTFELCEIPLEKRSKNIDTSRLIEREGKKLLAAIKPAHKIIALHVKGRSFSTEELATQFKQWAMHGTSIDLLIGGPDGLSTECLQKADMTWSLSPLTLPHPLVRILLAEQLYRVMSILQNHPYHR
ncbi:MAG: Ribosomal RNA large subunit methyltransferase H [uncultured bacterium]|nr:MAG: Ribosomal RNA large subunit methyltransferase H [uncultured bacterium]